MSKKTAKEILRIIASNMTISDFVHCYHNNQIIKDLRLGEVVTVKQKGGVDQGTEWYVVRHFVDHDVYIKTEAYYSSYDGIEADNYGYEVYPEEVLVTVYKPSPIIEEEDGDRVLTASELIIKLRNEISKSEFSEGDFDEDMFGEFTVIDTVGNHEGAGSYAHTVIHFKKHDVYIKLDGYYSSYSGCSWNDYVEVKPTQKTITVFE